MSAFPMRCRSVLLLLMLAGPMAVPAQEHGSRQEAVDMVNAAVAHVQRVGQERAFKDFSDKTNASWRKKDLYVFVVRSDGVTVAHGSNAKLIGKNMLGIKDQTGKPFIQQMIAVAKKGPGWVDYEWVHPETQRQEGKSSYVTPLPGFDGFVGVGIYR